MPHRPGDAGRDRARRGHSAPISRPTARFQLDPRWSVTASGPLRHRPHLPAPLRHHPRRPAALDRRRRADQPQQLHLDRRLGVPGPARHRRPASSSRSRCRRSMRAGGSPIPGSAARFELQANSLAILRTDGQDTQRAFASARWDRRGSRRSGQELMLTGFRAAAMSITPTTPQLTADRRSIAARRLARPRHRRARRRRALAVGRPLPRRHPAADAARPAGRLAADREPRHPQRGCARRSTSRTATCSRSTASPATTAGRTASRITYGVDWAVDRPGIVDPHQ